ncbi:MAG: TIGR03618 family F420-dependent PPOX class oxidoreductase [Chloroflexi bacterium]|nr:TIGR03618 family F420-dependent PPOX class oxidoreductase [Chloroflexota bacterium]
MAEPRPTTVPAEFNAFLAEARNGILTVARGDGRPPHATPVWFIYQDGAFRISITRTRLKYRLIERRPSVSLVIDDASRFRTVVVEGTARFSDTDAELVELAGRLQTKYRGRPPQQDETELLRGLRAEQRVVLTLEPDHVVSWSR